MKTTTGGKCRFGNTVFDQKFSFHTHKQKLQLIDLTGLAADKVNNLATIILKHMCTNMLGACMDAKQAFCDITGVPDSSRYMHHIHQVHPGKLSNFIQMTYIRKIIF